MSITVIGLGPGNPAQLTLEAWEILKDAEEIYLRTKEHPTVAALPSHIKLHSFDHLYEEKEDFASVYETIAQEVLALGRRHAGAIYAVPGHPLVGEASVSRLLALAREEGLVVRLVSGLSFVEPVLACLGLDALEKGLQVFDAMELAARHHPPFNPDVPALAGQLYSRHLASEVKLTLMNLLPDDHPVTLVWAAGTDCEQTRTLPLYELDRGEFDHLTTLYIPPLPQPGALETFQDTVACLRAPDGCPWDREQTHQSLRPCLLEETYEVLEALDADDKNVLCEELGDLLMQVFIHTQIAVENGDFKMPQVVGHIDSKIKRRHPHVFGEAVVKDSLEVLHNWEEIKRAERGEEGYQSILDGVPRSLPALAQAEAYQRRAARVGFDWQDVDGVVEKILEEIGELKTAKDPSAREREMGDLLFSLVNLARWLDVDAESALRAANARFASRFARMERISRARGCDLSTLPLAEQDKLWEEAKSENG